MRFAYYTKPYVPQVYHHLCREVEGILSVGVIVKQL